MDRRLRPFHQRGPAESELRGADALGGGWAGRDGMSRSGFDAALGPNSALLAFAAVFGAIAVWRFRWESEG